MTDISPYELILEKYNWTGMGASFTQTLPTTYLVPDNGTYTIGYKFVEDDSALLSTGYYSSNEDEYNYFSILDSLQENAAEVIMHKDSAYDYSNSVFFSDVTKLIFSPEDIQDAEIIFSQNDQDSIVFQHPGKPSSDIPGLVWHYEPDINAQYYQPVEKKYGDVFLNKDLAIGWGQVDEESSPQFWAVLHEIGHALGLADAEGSLIDNQKYTMMSYNVASYMSGLFTDV